MSTIKPPVARDAWEIPRLLLSVGLDYLRWTQLVPMVFAWFFLIATVLVMAAVNFQGDIDRALARAEARYEPLIESWFGPLEPDPETTAEPLQITWADVRGWILMAWGGLALAGYLLGALRAGLFGPRPPRGLGHKLGIAGAAAALASALLFLIWLFGNQTYHGSPWGWIAMFTLGPGLVWLISVYSLSVSHGLAWLREQLFDETKLAGRPGPA